MSFEQGSVMQDGDATTADIFRVPLQGWLSTDEEVFEHF
jgi:hypothetical protein